MLSGSSPPEKAASPRDDVLAEERALLSEWWAPAQAAAVPSSPSDEDRAVLAEWVSVGSSAPDPPVTEVPDPDLAALSEWAAPVVSEIKDPDLALMSEWDTGAPPGTLARSLALAESAATAAPMVGRVVRSRAEGTFAVSGLALASGHLAFDGITFPHRLSGTPRPESVRLVVTGDGNVAPGGLVVMADSGFRPSDEGFTLVLAASGPGRFHAQGRYEVGLG